MTGRNSNTLLIPILIFVTGFMLSCSVGDYLTAYFNTYFNASKLFAEAEQEIAAQQKNTAKDTTFLPAYALQAATKTKLTSVVEKCSKLLQYHPESSLVDNSLMMIGKAYYYQNELQKAERKFAELPEAYPESDLVPEAKLFLSYTYYRMREYDQAVELASSLADSTGEEDEAIAARAFYLIGEVRYQNQDLDGALSAFRFSAQLGESGEERASSHMRIGSIELLMDDPEGAVEAYRDAEDEATDYRTEYRARMGRVNTLIQIGEFDRGRELLEDLRSNAGFTEFYAEIDLEIANSMMMQGNLEEAMADYYTIDTAYVKTSESAESHYRLGYLYETEFLNYDSALAVYDRGKTQSPKAEITREIVRRAELLRRYQSISAEILRLSEEKRMILNPELRDSIASLTMPDSVDGPSEPDSVIQAPPEVAPLRSLGTVDSALARNKADLGGLFYSGLVVVDSSLYWYQDLLREHPGSPFAPRALYTMAQIYADDKSVSSSVVDSLYEEIIRQYPETEFADEARRILGYPPRKVIHDPAIGLYAEAESLLTRDSTLAALASFKTLVRDYPSSPIAPKANYAIAWIYEQSSSSSDSAIAYYSRLVEHYPSSTYSNTATRKLQSVPKEEEGVADSTGTSEELPQGENGSAEPSLDGPKPEESPPDSSNGEERGGEPNDSGDDGNPDIDPPGGA